MTFFTSSRRFATAVSRGVGLLTILPALISAAVG
jgi:hypothetical protein